MHRKEGRMESHEVDRIPDECINNTKSITPDEASNDDDEKQLASSIADKIRNISISVSNEVDKSSGVSRISSVGTTSVLRPLKNKLLVLDVNGLLVDLVCPRPKDHKADTVITGRAVFKRPFYLEFLKFCFENFEVAVWTSRMKKNVDKVLTFLIGDMKHKLLFCWDHSHCTMTEFKTLENKHKPLVFKDLRKIWEKHDPNLPWEKGYFNESNTLLLDDSPYKALLNPLHTSIFPFTYDFRNKDDNSLAIGGDLREYLGGLAKAENMAEYVGRNPYGQEGINEKSASWNFYLEVLGSIATQKLEKMSLSA
ncbi:ubiquitin-like domain-containing CTD phosphatase 1 [Senna tora]|uniref:Mitochondrial import inner membrane translocase subunit TIM50 n=1 Tax=Senna tora TaxID=362788 RepID=A0A834W253_9FABA|nr:ubiquitin-like domain-containing CTD phosphatase 1 [Senna tora]